MKDIREKLVDEDTELSEEALDEIDQLRAAIHYFKLKTQSLENAVKEAHDLLFAAVDRYPTEKDPKIWTSKVREWLNKAKIE